MHLYLRDKQQNENSDGQGFEEIERSKKIQ